ncbi:MAG: hypothetical protein EOM40_01985 [Clostridia bacterium]|nr:hypothetical protein [Clostridia bacterium]NCC43667.1 hypothetical protein [Clostridia bacterium]
MKKGAVVICLAAVLMISIKGMSGSYAWFLSSDEQHNYLSTGNNDVEIKEEFPEPEIIEKKKVKKLVEFTNTGTVACFIRAKYLFSDATIQDMVTLEFGSDKWAAAEDGYYYYSKSILPNEKTEPFLTAVTFGEIGDIASDFDLSIYTETVQSDGHKTAQEAFAHLSR